MLQVEAVSKYKCVYTNFPKKETSSKTYETGYREKLSIDGQIEYVVVETLSENNLGYTDRCDGENIATHDKYLRLEISSFKFVHEHHNNIYRGQKARFGITI